MSLTELGHFDLPQPIASKLQEWGFKSLTDIQQKAIKEGIIQGQSAIICAPTSSGKTLVGELALLNAFQKQKRCLYLVSHKALAEQKYLDFNRRFGAESGDLTATVGLNTGDREEGDIRCSLLIATYEKALGLILSGQLVIQDTIVIADELQILGDKTRGPSVETLCALIRAANPAQFVGLTATVENPIEIAEWLKCKSVISHKRDVELVQMIWHRDRKYKISFGQDTGEEIHNAKLPTDTLDAVSHLLSEKCGPILVFTETRREAANLAEAFSKKRVKTADGLKIAGQLELFSEPTEASDQLQTNAERRVAFHSADLTPRQRQVLEEGFAQSAFDVCFATSTLAAGVNFPFRTVVFPKLTYQYGSREGTLITRADYRNMSGRAGRLGLHPNGMAVLLPSNQWELLHANTIVLPENDRIDSELVSLSIRKTILALITSKVVGTIDEVRQFFHNTFFWHQILEKNPKQLEAVLSKAQDAVSWLSKNGLIESHENTYLPTPLGKATAISGLLPATTVEFVNVLTANVETLRDNFDDYIAAIIHWTCNCPEYTSEKPSRFLAWPSDKLKPGSTSYLTSRRLFNRLDRTEDKMIQCVHALCLYVEGEAERKIRFQTGVSSGQLHQMAIDVSWMLDGVRGLACVSDLGVPQCVANHLGMLARRVRWGATPDALDIIRIGERHDVPGFGRQRAMALITNGIKSLTDILSCAKAKLGKILGNDERADALVEALSHEASGGGVNFAGVHRQIASEIGMRQFVDDCNTKLGTEYDEAICRLLKQELAWIVEKVDKGKRQNSPDLLLALGELQIIIECKTVTKKPPLVDKEAAFAVLQKAADWDTGIKRCTLGKPGFDESSKVKAMASSQITLVEHQVFMEGILRVLTGRCTANQFVEWLAEPGIAEINRLSGSPTFIASGTVKK